MKERLAQLPEVLSLPDGLPGQEQPAVPYLKEKLEFLAEEVHIGVNGNIFAGRRGQDRGWR